MTDIKFRSDLDCDLINYMGGDLSVIRAMLVSTKGLVPDEEITDSAMEGRINFLMRNRHGTPFEHGSMTFRISTPIFVIRELHRHRIGFSYNEESGRYKQLDPVFYVPATDREMYRVGKAGNYEFRRAPDAVANDIAARIKAASNAAYWQYEAMLDLGIAPEVARMVLPVNIFSSQYVTCNPRSLMSFLSLRKKLPPEVAAFPSKPLKEINMLADEMEHYFELHWPLTHRAFVANKYVAP